MNTPTTSSSGRPKQAVGLAVLLVVLGGVIWFQFFRTAGTNAPASNSVTGRPDAAATTPMPAPQVVRLGELTAVSEPGEVGRNPFAYGARPAPPPPPRPEGPPPGFVSAPPMAPPMPQGPPPIGLKLTGITTAQQGGRPMVSLKDPLSNALFQAFEGDIVDGRYRVVKVGTQSVVLSYVDGSGTRTISLGG
ncbi:MAG: hypothetical protein ABI634_14275 [Acidobacteriota bacterium]